MRTRNHDMDKKQMKKYLEDMRDYYQSQIYLWQKVGQHEQVEAGKRDLCNHLLDEFFSKSS